MRRFYCLVSILVVIWYGGNVACAATFSFGAMMDPFLNFELGKDTVEADIEFRFGSKPSVELIELVPGYTVERNITENLDFLAERGFTLVSMVAVEGFGELYVDVPILREIVHDGFDYDSQYVDPTDPESDLRPDLSEETARQRYAFIGDIIPFFAAEAHKRGLRIDINFESLAHIINRAQAEGIGAGDEEITIAGNLPPLSPEQISRFLEELKAAVLAADPTISTFTVSEEAFGDEYVRVISETTDRLGITHHHAGPSHAGWGDIWAAYYYSFYPLSQLQLDIYTYLITASSTPPVGAETFGAARAMGKRSELVVGHYTPWPADPAMGIEDLYDPNRVDPELGWIPINPDDPRDVNGNPVETRTAGLQKNYFLYGLVAEHVTDFFFAVDLMPAFDALARMRLDEDILPRLSRFSHVLGEQRPIINVIIDIAEDQGNDAFTADNEISDFSQDMVDWVVPMSISEPVFASIAAAGFEPWVTYNAPLDGREPVAYWIITAGGGEEIESEGNSQSPPHWTNADDLDDTLLSLIDPARSDKPVIISTMAGIPNRGNWAKVREIFGIPKGRGGTPGGPAYASANLIAMEEYQTSIATNLLTNSFGEVLTFGTGESMTMDVLPETIDWEGQSVRLNGFDPARFGVVINVIDPGEVPAENIVLASSRADQSDWLRINDPDDRGTNVVTTYRKTVYIFRNGLSGNKILINPNIYHVEMMFPLSNILCDITGRPRTMNRPCLAYIAAGETTAVFALTETEVDLNLPLAEGNVWVNRFDGAGRELVRDQVVARADLFPMRLNRHELAVFTGQPGGETFIQNWSLLGR